MNHKLHSLLSYLPFYHLHPSPHLSQISRLNHHHHQNLLNHHPNPCDSHLLHLNHHRKIFSLNPKNPPISSQVLELHPCDSWRRRRRRGLISQRAVNLPLLNLLLHQRRERRMMWRSWMWGT